MEQQTASTAMRAARFGLPLLILAGCLWLLSQKLSGTDFTSLPGHLRDITGVQWALAGALSVASFWAVGHYDALAHRALRTGIRDHQARLTGSVGIALGQTLGFGLVTGALARWRMLPDFKLTDALRLSTYVSLSFILAWIVVTSVLCLVLPAPDWTFWPAISAIIIAILGFWVMFRTPVVRWRCQAFHLPSLTLTAAFVFWAALDTSFAAAAFYVFVPDAGLSYLSFLPLFLLALGAALVSNTPGGVGPFELVLLTALPQAAPETLMTAIIAYRLVYYALPAAIAMLALLRPLEPSPSRSRPVGNYCSVGPRSEVGAILQNGGAFQCVKSSCLALWPTGQTVTLFSDPISGTPDAALSHISVSAHSTVKSPFIYKCGDRMAAAARNAGWSVIHLADDAIIDLATYDHNVPSRRTLRRKLRAREKADVQIVTAAQVSFAELVKVDAAWQNVHGRARGGSMGRVSENYIKNQWIVSAYQNGTLIAFITVHIGQKDWCLDIMRHCADVPDGTMHSLVDAAIFAASAAGASQFCLAATPACPDPHSAHWRWVALKVVARTGGPGLRQFKSTFAPRWAPRYVAAPSRFQLVLGLADVTQEILSPRPPTETDSNQPHHVDEDYELDSRQRA